MGMMGMSHQSKRKHRPSEQTGPIVPIAHQHQLTPNETKQLSSAEHFVGPITQALLPPGESLAPDMSVLNAPKIPPILPPDNAHPTVSPSPQPISMAIGTPAAAQPAPDHTHLLLFAYLHTYLEPRCESDDVHVLTFGLHHFFAATARLYETILPELMACELQRKTRAPEGNELVSIYGIWMQLHRLSGVFARVEALSYLLISSLLNLLDALDLTALHVSSPASPPEPARLVTPAEYQQALDQMHTRLQSWRQSRQNTPLFVELFAHREYNVPALNQLDQMTMLLLETGETIFHDLLPAFYTLPLRHDAPVVTALLNLTQKIDQVQFSIGTLQEPLLQLLQKHAREFTL